MTTKPNPLPLALVRSSYQPSKAELNAPIEFPEGATPDDLAKALVRTADVTWKHSPEWEKPE